MLVMPPTAFTPARPRTLTDIEFCAWNRPGDCLATVWSTTADSPRDRHAGRDLDAPNRTAAVLPR